MLKIQKNKKQFIDCFNIIKNLVIETDINFNKEEIFIRATHPSNHCMAIIKIKKSLFEEYNVDKERVYTIDIENLVKILNNLSEKQLEIIPENDVLVFKDYRRKYKLNYFVGSKDIRPTPQFEHKTKINMSSSEFFGLISESIVFDQIGNFEIEEGKLFVNSKSHLVSGNIQAIIKNIEGQNDKVYFDFSYIDMVKGIKNLFEDIELGLNNEFPLSIKCKNSDIDFEFILANRVENE